MRRARAALAALADRLAVGFAALARASDAVVAGGGEQGVGGGQGEGHGASKSQVFDL